MGRCTVINAFRFFDRYCLYRYRKILDSNWLPNNLWNNLRLPQYTMLWRRILSVDYRRIGAAINWSRLDRRDICNLRHT